MGNFWKYNDRVSTGAGVSGLDTADGGDAIGDNEIIRGDGTTGIQGGVLTSADHNGDISGPTASTDTTVAGGDFANQPANDSITVASDNAADTGITVTLIGTTNGVDTVVVEALPLDGTDATTPVVSVKVDWGILLAAKLSGAAAGNITIQKTTGPATIIAIATPNTSAGVDTGSISCWNRIPYVVASGASTKQIGLKGTNSAGATIYDSQALTGATSLLMNSAFVTVTEYYVGDLESTRTATITAQAGVGIATITGTSANGNVTIDPQGTGKLIVDNLSVTGNTIASTNTNGNINLTPNGTGQLVVPAGSATAPSITTASNSGIYFLDGYPTFTASGTLKVGLYGNEFYGANSAFINGFLLEVAASTAGVGAPAALSTTHNQSVQTNEGATAMNYRTLPAAAAGFNFTLVVQDADGIRIVASGDDTIRVIDKVTAAAGYIESTTIGSVVTLVAINATEWIATSINGVWTDGTWTYDDTGLTSP